MESLTTTCLIPMTPFPWVEVDSRSHGIGYRLARTDILHSAV